MLQRLGVPTLLLCFALPAAAQGDLAWRARAEPLTYGALPPPAAKLKTPEGVTVALGAGDPTWAIAGPGDLVWHYALTLPADRRVPADGKATREVTDSFTLPSGKRIDVTGTRRVGRVGAGRVRLQLSLLLTGGASGSLDMDVLFDAQSGRLDVADFSLWAGASWSGRIERRAVVSAAEAPTAGAPPAEEKQGPPAQDEPKPEEPAPPKADEPVDPLHLEVVRSIARGAKWLLPMTQQWLLRSGGQPRPGSQSLGRMALPCFALLRSGVEPEVLNDAFAWMRAQPLEETYSVALYVMALEARSVAREALPAKPEPSRTVTRFQRHPMPVDDKLLIQGAVGWLLDARNKGQGSWTYRALNTTRGLRGGGFGDRSNSQFAVLALHSALAAGVEIPGELWEELARERLGSQERTGPAQDLAGTVTTSASPLAVTQPPAGRTRKRQVASEPPTRARGWDYSMSREAPSGSAYGSMTAAGVSSLAISLEGLRGLGPRAEAQSKAARAALRDGLSWLLHHFDARANPAGGERAGGRGHYYYYAYSLEKAMDTAGVERLGNTEWWRELARTLLDKQLGDGGWGSIVDTSFALLVLNRATLSARIEGPSRLATGPGGGKRSWEWVPVQEELVSAPQCLAALRVAGVERQAFKRAKQAWSALPIEHRPRVLPTLAELIERSDKPIQRWARARCQELAGTSDPTQAQARFETWEALRLAGDAADHQQIPRARALLSEKSTPEFLCRQALSTLARLGGVEGLGDVIDLLARRDREGREWVWANVVSLAGGEPVFYDPSAGRETRAQQLDALRAWWIKVGPEKSEQARIRRAVQDLARPERVADAKERLRACGQAALRPLVDALRSPASRSTAHELLVTLTGQRLPPVVEPWLEWLDANR